MQYMQLTAIERIRLLIHIVRELHTSHGITVETLKVADRPIRDQIRPKSRLRFLEEIYDIRRAEERLLSRQTGNVLLTLFIGEANIFHKDRQPVKQPSYPDVFLKTKAASRAIGPTGCTENDRNSTQSKGTLVSDWVYDPDFNVSFSSFTYCGPLQHVTSRQDENCQDYVRLLTNSGQPAIPFHVQQSEWEPFTGSPDYTSQFPYWYEGANALAQGERYNTAHPVLASRPL